MSFEDAIAGDVLLWDPNTVVVMYTMNVLLILCFTFASFCAATSSRAHGSSTEEGMGARHSDSGAEGCKDAELAAATERDADFSFEGLAAWGKVVRVIDGDTVVVVLRYAGQLVQVRLRLMDIDSPELHPKRKKFSSEEDRLAEKAAGEGARDAMREKCEGKVVWVKIVRSRDGDGQRFGRGFGYLWREPSDDPARSINNEMLTEGWAAERLHK